MTLCGPVMRPSAGTSLSVLLAICLAVALLLASVLSIAFDEDFYSTYLAKHGSYSRFDSREEVDSAISGMLAFFRGEQESLPEIFDEDEQSHLADVKVLLDRSRLLCVLLVALWFASNLSALRKPALVARNLVAGGIAALVLTALLLLAALFFSQTFLLFHEVFFPQGNWQFPLESALIRLFPRGFFFDLFTQVILRTALLGLVSLGIGEVVKKTTARPSSRDARNAP